MLNIGITTAPRKETYIDKTIDSLRDVGVKDTIYVFAEPNSAIPKDKNTIFIQNQEKRGCFMNRDYAAHYLMEKGDYFLILQDDFVFASDFKQKLSKCLENDEKR